MSIRKTLREIRDHLPIIIFLVKQGRLDDFVDRKIGVEKLEYGDGLVTYRIVEKERP